jgi:hypothetical protein
LRRECMRRRGRARPRGPCAGGRSTGRSSVRGGSPCYGKLWMACAKIKHAKCLIFGACRGLVPRRGQLKMGRKALFQRPVIPRFIRSFPCN